MNKNKIKNQICWISWLIFTIFNTAFSQSESPKKDKFIQDSSFIQTQLPIVQINHFQLNEANQQLFLQSATLNGQAKLLINGEEHDFIFKNGQALYQLKTDEAGQLLLFRTSNQAYSLYHIAKKDNGHFRIQHIPLWLSLLPPLVAIFLAFLFKEVIISLFVGIWTGAFIIGGLRIDSLYYFVLSFFKVVEKYIVQAVSNPDHVAIIVFTMLIGGMVAVISRNGGMAGVVLSLSKYAQSARRSQLITWLLGIIIFFDDYTNTLIVGNTMRSVTDKYRVSREKLAYIVDSTAAPVVSVAFITTWIGAELGYIDAGIKLLDNFDPTLTPYALFIGSLKYSFYPFLTLAFVLMIIYSGRDFGPMYQAEVRARTSGKVSNVHRDSAIDTGMEDLSPVHDAPLKWYHAAIPVLVLIGMTVFGLIDTGMATIYDSLTKTGTLIPSQGWADTWQAMNGLEAGKESSFLIKIGELIGNSNSYTALLWASTSSLTVALAMTIGSKIMSLADSIHTTISGFKMMLSGFMILILAWSLAIITDELHTAQYLTYTLQDSINPYLMPPIIFVLAAATAFSTGSSWSTMAILYPIAIPTTWAICQTQGIAPDVSLEILLNVISTVLAASVLGDHCSPISDTTILSSLASDCDHIDHVRTQMPYALVVGSVSLSAGFLTTFFGGGWGICFLVGSAGLGILMWVVGWFGRKVE